MSRYTDLYNLPTFWIRKKRYITWWAWYLWCR